jgi:hypothetical protein
MQMRLDYGHSQALMLPQPISDGVDGESQPTPQSDQGFLITLEPLFSWIWKCPGGGGFNCCTACGRE